MNIKVVQNDKLYDLNFTLQNYDGTALDLTGATALLKVQKANSTSLKFSGSMTLVSPASGTLKYTVQTSDFTEAGNYYGEIELTYPSTQKLTFPGILIEVLPELPKTN